ncbi:MAG: hypothetical protein HYV29_11965 [Ignavibacteriales bacterium]|nr:hypothetical protein [Ignavibacteriales bacterium]
MSKAKFNIVRDDLIFSSPPIFVVTNELSMGTTGDTVNAVGNSYTGVNSEPTQILFFEENLKVPEMMDNPFLEQSRIR